MCLYANCQVGRIVNFFWAGCTCFTWICQVIIGLEWRMLEWSMFYNEWLPFFNSSCLLSAAVELSQMLPEKPSFVSCDNKEVFVPSVLCGILQEPQTQLSNKTWVHRTEAGSSLKEEVTHSSHHITTFTTILYYPEVSFYFLLYYTPTSLHLRGKMLYFLVHINFLW